MNERKDEIREYYPLKIILVLFLLQYCMVESFETRLATNQQLKAAFRLE